MRLADCEITHRHIRGHNVAFVFGARAVSDDEAQALADEWTEAYGPIALPGYVSPQGWQSLAPLERGPIASRLKVDELAQVVEFDGVKISAELLATFGEPSPQGWAFRILQSKDGVATVGRVQLNDTPRPNKRAAGPAATPPPAAPPDEAASPQEGRGKGEEATASEATQATSAIGSEVQTTGTAAANSNADSEA